MRFLPYERFTISSPHSIDTLRQRLQDNVEPRKYIRILLTKAGKAFEGEVGESTFEIRRIIGYRNSFLPLILGKFERVLNRTDIQITFRLHFFLMVFVILWSGILTLVMTAMWTSHGEIGPAAWMPPGMLVFLYLLTILSFGFEANKARRLLNQIFQ